MTARQRLRAGVGWLVDRLREKSSVAALAGAIVVLGGWHVAPDRIGAIATLVSFAMSGVAFVTKERP